MLWPHHFNATVVLILYVVAYYNVSSRYNHFVISYSNKQPKPPNIFLWYSLRHVAVLLLSRTWVVSISWGLSRMFQRLLSASVWTDTMSTLQPWLLHRVSSYPSTTSPQHWEIYLFKFNQWGSSFTNSQLNEHSGVCPHTAFNLPSLFWACPCRHYCQRLTNPQCGPH